LNYVLKNILKLEDFVNISFIFYILKDKSNLISDLKRENNKETIDNVL